MARGAGAVLMDIGMAIVIALLGGNLIANTGVWFRLGGLQSGLEALRGSVRELRARVIKLEEGKNERISKTAF